jgi:ribosomal protein S18 acetylase RimI-like enzyme
MLKLLDPTPAELARKIAEGIVQGNEASSIGREDFAFTCQSAGGLAGGVTASVSFSVLFINNIWVAREHRRSGLGRSLLSAAEREGFRRGARVGCVDTLSSQAPAFYEKLGYREFGRVRGDVDGQAIDRIWLSKPLCTSDA